MPSATTVEPTVPASNVRFIAVNELAVPAVLMRLAWNMPPATASSFASIVPNAPALQDTYPTAAVSHVTLNCKLAKSSVSALVISMSTGNVICSFGCRIRCRFSPSDAEMCCAASGSALSCRAAARKSRAPTRARELIHRFLARVHVSDRSARAEPRCRYWCRRHRASNKCPLSLTPVGWKSSA